MKSKPVTHGKDALVVLGMHRSGTSAMSKVLSLAGARLPLRLMGAGLGNPDGHWEPQDVADLNDRIFAELDSGWSDVFGPRRLLQRRLPTDKFIPEAREIIRANYKDSQIIVLKEPRVGIFVDLWKDALILEGYNPSFVFTIRHPAEVAASLKVRDGLSLNKSILLWATYTLTGEYRTRNYRRIFVKYEDLLHGAESILDTIESHLKVSLPRRTWDSALEIQNFLKVDHRHHTESKFPEGMEGLEQVEELYSALNLARSGGNFDTSVADKSSVWLNNLSQIVSPILKELERELIRSRNNAHAFEAARDNLVVDLNSAHEQLAEKDRILGQLVTDIELARNAISELAAAEAAAREHVSTLEAELEATKGLVSSLNASLEDVAMERSEIEKNRDEALEDIAGREFSAREEFVSAQALISMLKVELTEKDLQLSQLGNDIEVTRNYISDLTGAEAAAREHISTLEAELEATKDLVSRLNASLLEVAADRLEFRTSHDQALTSTAERQVAGREEFESAEQLIAALKATLTDKDRQLSRLNNDIEIARNAISDLTAAEAAAREQVSTLAAELEATKDLISGLNASLEDVAKERLEVGNLLAAQAADKAAMVTEIESVRASLARQTADQRQLSQARENQAELLRRTREELNLASNLLQQMEMQHQEIVNSTTWRVVRGLVSIITSLPPPARAQLRRAFKLAYWVITPWRTSERIRILRHRTLVAAPLLATHAQTSEIVSTMHETEGGSETQPIEVEQQTAPPQPAALEAAVTPEFGSEAPARISLVSNESEGPLNRAVWKDVTPERLIGAPLLAESAASTLSPEAKIVAESPLFDASWYLSRYPDIAETGQHPAEHYVEHGAREGRDPSAHISTKSYLEKYPDVAVAGVNPLVHYLLYGVFEGRSFQPNTRPQPHPISDFSIIYISGEPDTPGNHYRVIRYGAAVIESRAARATWMRADEVESRLADFETADIVVIWRALWSPALAAAIGLMHSRGKNVVFDVDDLMTEPDLASTDIIDGIRSQNLTEETTRAHYTNVRKSMLASDIGFAPTEELAFFLRGNGKPTFVLPNGFDHTTLGKARRAIRRRRNAAQDSYVRIGYAGGSRTHQRDIGVMVEALARVLREHPQCLFVLFRTPDNTTPLIDVEEYPSLAGLEDRIEWRHLQPIHELPNELARFDINLAPLEFGNPFCEAKSELKFFEAGLVEVPTIASPTGPFNRVIDHGKTGFLAATADEWYTHLSSLIGDKDLRRRVGRQAYHAALAKFGPIQRAEAIGRVIPQIAGGGQMAAHAWALDVHLKTTGQSLPKILHSEVIFDKDNLKDSAVTVVIPLYNYEQYIVEALDSVFNQTLEHIDLVIVDGFSTDNSLKVAKDWIIKHHDRFNRAILLKNISNYGLGLCRNSGFDAAESPYILLLDADNRLLPNCCADLLETIETHSCAFAYGSIQQFGRTSAKMSNEPYEPQRFVAGNFIDAMALVSKEAWAMIGGYNHVRFGWEDYDFWCRLAERGLRGERDLRTVAEYRTHAISMLQTQTTVPKNYRALWNDFSHRHPWVSLGEQVSTRLDRQPAARLATEAKQKRVTRLLSIMRCPETKQKFTISADGNDLITVDGSRRWPMREGRPVLVAGMEEPEVRPQEHVSNQMSDRALEIIREADGLVLHLSAGGTPDKPDHVIEVEHAIFRNTDIVGDAHKLPFDDETFSAVIALNAFEHYRDPRVVAAELHRVLKPGGRILILTAFMQPLHEKPWHFYNATRYGVAEWFSAFEQEELNVSPNFCPNHSIAWMASELEAALRFHVSTDAADTFGKASIDDLVRIWRDPTLRSSPLWRNFESLPEAAQDVTAAGFEFVGYRPVELPVI